jgi:hypothetical protein
MSKLCTGIERIDRNWRCRMCKRTTYEVLWIVRDEWCKAQLSAGTVREARLYELLREPVKSRVEAKYGISWVWIALMIAEIILRIWIERHSLEACSQH